MLETKLTCRHITSQVVLAQTRWQLVSAKVSRLHFVPYFSLYTHTHTRPARLLVGVGVGATQEAVVFRWSNRSPSFNPIHKRSQAIYICCMCTITPAVGSPNEQGPRPKDSKSIKLVHSSVLGLLWLGLGQPRVSAGPWCQLMSTVSQAICLHWLYFKECMDMKYISSGKMSTKSQEETIWSGITIQVHHPGSHSTKGWLHQVRPTAPPGGCFHRCHPGQSPGHVVGHGSCSAAVAIHSPWSPMNKSFRLRLLIDQTFKHKTCNPNGWVNIKKYQCHSISSALHDQLEVPSSLHAKACSWRTLDRTLRCRPIGHVLRNLNGIKAQSHGDILWNYV